MRAPEEFIEHCFQGTPRTISPEIRSFSQHLSADHDPVFVPVKYEDGDEAGECFHNVMRRVSAGQGQIVYGWALWEWPGVFLEAEHHAVLTVGERLVDVTPAIPPQTQILFLPAPSLAYDFDGGKRLLNKRWQLSQNPTVAEYLDVTHELLEIAEANSTANEIKLGGQALRRYRDLAFMMRHLKAQIIHDLLHKTRRNDLCICGSGAKFKKCCGIR